MIPWTLVFSSVGFIYTRFFLGLTIFYCTLDTTNDSLRRSWIHYFFQRVIFVLTVYLVGWTQTSNSLSSPKLWAAAEMRSKFSFQPLHFLLETRASPVFERFNGQSRTQVDSVSRSASVAPPSQHSPPNFLTVLPPFEFLLLTPHASGLGVPQVKDYKLSIPTTVSSSRRNSGLLQVRVRRCFSSLAPPLHSRKEQNREVEAAGTHRLQGSPNTRPSRAQLCSSSAESARTRSSHSGRIDFQAPHSSLLIHSGMRLK